MKSILEIKLNNFLFQILVISILLTGIWIRFFTLGSALYGDPFHHGEFVASLPFMLANNFDFFTIHGSSDWVPAWFSYQINGGERYFLLTMLIHSALDAVACLVLYSVIVLLTGKDSNYRSIILVVSAVLVVYLVGIRDVFLILAIWFYFFCERSSSPQVRIMLTIMLGMMLAVNLFWSFDRGIVGVLGIGLACLMLVITDRRYLFVVISFVATLLMMIWMGALSLSVYYENIVFLIATSSQWSYGYSLKPMIMTFMAMIPNGLAIYYLGKSFYQSRRFDWRKYSQLLLLIVVTILLLKSGINRADPPHVIRTLWMPVLVFLYLRERESFHLPFFANAVIIVTISSFALGVGNYWFLLGVVVPLIYLIKSTNQKLIDHITYPKFVSVVIAIPLLCVYIVKIISNYSQNGYIWISQISMPPNNRSLVSEGIQWVSKEMLKVGSNCVFDLSNNGVINGITGLPACTKYTYPVYATQKYEVDMLIQLQQHNPPVIVFSSTHWAFSIDGKSMHVRFPKLKEYLLQTYPYENCNFGYCLRYSKQSG